MMFSLRLGERFSLLSIVGVKLEPNTVLLPGSVYLKSRTTLEYRWQRCRIEKINRKITRCDD